MNNYADFLLNEVIGAEGLDDEQASQILRKIDELRDESSAENPKAGN